MAGTAKAATALLVAGAMEGGEGERPKTPRKSLITKAVRERAASELMDRTRAKRQRKAKKALENAPSAWACEVCTKGHMRLKTKPCFQTTLGGEPVTVEITPDRPIKRDQFAKQLRVRSLVDTYRE